MSTATQKDVTPLAEVFLRLSARQKCEFLASFVHSMTVAVRDFYSLDAAAAADKLRQWNELLHRVAGNLDAMLAGSEERYPDELLVKLIEDAAEDGLGREVAWASERALARAADRHERKKAAAPSKTAQIH